MKKYPSLFDMPDSSYEEIPKTVRDARKALLDLETHPGYKLLPLIKGWKNLSLDHPEKMDVASITMNVSGPIPAQLVVSPGSLSVIAHLKTIGILHFPYTEGAWIAATQFTRCECETVSTFFSLNLKVLENPEQLITATDYFGYYGDRWPRHEAIHEWHEENEAIVSDAKRWLEL